MASLKSAVSSLALVSCLCVSAANGWSAPLKTRNVFLIISDGFRWQEVFRGAEESLMNPENGGVEDTNALRQAFWRDSVEARRRALLPFFWNEIAAHGQLFGNRDRGNGVKVTNGKNFSYPGYNEILTGAGDPRIDSNDSKPNPNVTVFEWLNGHRRLHGRVAVFGTWELFPYIFNLERSQLPTWPVWEEKFLEWQIRPPRMLGELLRDTTPVFDDVTYDSFLFHATGDYLKRKRPRLMFVGFGETDEWAHIGRYAEYLTAAHHVDQFIRRLWEMAQALPQYRGKTTLIITADHGRGSGRSEWRDHGEKIQESENDWLAIMGPDTPPAGERSNGEPHTQSQIASTIAALLGQDYHAAFPNTGRPILEALPASQLKTPAEAVEK